MKHNRWCAALLVVWCLLFLRGDNTEKSMVRALFLEKAEGWTVTLLYQAPEAEADASEAGSGLKVISAAGTTLEQALAAAEQALPRPASYRLCDYLLFPQALPQSALQEYEQLVLARRCGRTGAKLVCTGMDAAQFQQAADGQNAFADVLMDTLTQKSAFMPRLYQCHEILALPVLVLEDSGTARISGGQLWTPDTKTDLTGQQMQIIHLLLGRAGGCTVWLDGQQVSFRRCSVSAEVVSGQASLRLDAQLMPGTPRPASTQRQELEALCTETVQRLWQQGIDLMHLGQYAALRGEAVPDPTKNACPQLRTDVHFLKLF